MKLFALCGLEVINYKLECHFKENKSFSDEHIHKSQSGYVRLCIGVTKSFLCEQVVDAAQDRTLFFIFQIINEI